MKGYLRSLCYWAYCMERLFLSLVGTVLVMSAVWAFMDTEGMNWYRWMTNYISVLGIMSSIVNGMNLSSIQVPLALSSGSTRKETACGVIVMTHIVILQFWILAVIIDSLLLTVHAADGFFMVCGILFIVSCGIGNGLGAVILRFGSKVGMTIYIVMILLIIGGAGTIFALCGIDEILPFISTAGVFVAGVIFDVAMAIAFYLGIRKYEVRI